MFKHISQLMFPCRCSVCNKVIYLGKEMCDDCVYELRVIPEHISLMLISNPNINLRLGFKPVYSGVAAPYYHEDGGKSMIYNLKFKNRRELALPISHEMYNTYKQYISNKDIDCICSVPSKFKNTFIRGYDHVKILAKLTAEHTGLSYYPLLKLNRKKKSQHTLNAEERLKNIRGSFKINNKCQYDFKGKNVLIIDDIMTTGATISECSRVLKRKGAKNVYGLTATINL